MLLYGQLDVQAAAHKLLQCVSAKLSLPGNRVGLKTTGFGVYVGMGSSMVTGTAANRAAVASSPAAIPVEKK